LTALSILGSDSKKEGNMKHFFLGRKAQVTIFIIIGILVLAVGGVFFFTREGATREAEFINPEFKPVSDFVYACIKDSAREAIDILSLTGGYINFPESIRHNPLSYLSDGPIKEFRNPYWWYDGIEAIPPKEYIEKEIADYVDSGLRNCTDGFKVFQDEFIVNEGDIRTYVVLAENDVPIVVDYPLTIIAKHDKSRTSVSRFKVNLPVRLKKIYDLARRIIDEENRGAFLEKKTIDLLSLDREIPTTDIAVKCGKMKWFVGDLEKRMKKLLRINLPFVRLRGSDFELNSFVPTSLGADTFNNSYYKYHYIWDVTDDNLKGISASVQYDDKWPMTFYVRPNNGNYIQSNSQRGQDILRFFCMHIWHFTYDIVYPVKITLVDAATDDWEELRFMFAFKVSVDHNQPRRDSYSTATFETKERLTSEEFCLDTKHELSISTWNNVTVDPVKHVNITFICGRFQCDMGETEFVSDGAAAALQKRFPYCTLGLIKAKKEGYTDAAMFVQTDKPKNYEMYMMPLKLIDNFDVIMHPYNIDSGVVGPGKQLNAEDKASIMLDEKNGRIQSFALYPGDEDFPLKLLADEDYEYNLQIFLVNGENMVGGYLGNWDVSWSDLSDAQSIIFHVVAPYPEPSDETERYLFIAGLEEYSKKLPKPEIK